MFNSRIFWKIYFNFIWFILFTGIGVGIFVANEIYQGELEQSERTLTTYATLFSEITEQDLKGFSPEQHARIKELNRKLGVRLTVIDVDGVVVTDSDEEFSKMENHGERPEVITARETGRGVSIRYSNTVLKNMMYVALPIMSEGKIIGYSRASFALSDIYLRISQHRNIGIFAVVIGALLALVFGFFLARQIVFPLSRMIELANSIAEGDFEKRIPVKSKNEFGRLAIALNTMAAQITEDISRREKAEAELQKAHDELEQRVRSRTTQLSAANDLLNEQIAERHHAELILQASEERYRDLIENANDIIYTTDLKGKFTSLNKAGEELTGYRAEQWQDLSIFDLVAPEYHDLLEQMANETFDGVSRTNFEVEVLSTTGNRLTLEVSSRILMLNEEPVGVQGIARDITERKRAQEQLVHDAFHDGLTGLANRALFMDHLRMTIERGKSRHYNPYAVFFLDLDRFKVINDSLGHAEGDELLIQIAGRLENATRTGDLVARLGGDEFVVLSNELVVEDDDAIRIAKRIQSSLKKPFDLSGNEIFITASIGIALSSAGHETAEDMVRDADIAMYRAKTKGRAQYQIFDQAMHEQASSQLQVEIDLRHALERNEFRLHYQPIVELSTQRLVGFEALVRWMHPSRGLIQPSDFIAIAEESSLILPLGEWILNESCRQLNVWHKENPGASKLTVSVNLSSKQFAKPDLADRIAAALDSAGVDPRCLKLEITESHIMENTGMAVTIMNKLRAIGVELSLDDFGTGYSSLSYLHRLPVNYLKIDRSFIARMTKNEENSEIAQTIIRLAQNLKMQVVAEGIETADQLARLKKLNCEFGQGYYFSVPLEPTEAGDLVSTTFKRYALAQPEMIGNELSF